MARERQITITLLPRLWVEFERRRHAASTTGAPERGLDSAVINEWLFECLMRSGSGDAPALPPLALPEDDDDSFGIDKSRL